ncbi:winged helix-turn-helix domain-containing protein, partial [Methanolobus psychrotolerans]
KLTDYQKEELKNMLHKRDDWSTKEVRELIYNEFKVQYTIKQILVILKKFGMHHAKPYTHDHRRPEDAEDRLKKTYR